MPNRPLASDGGRVGRRRPIGVPWGAVAISDANDIRGKCPTLSFEPMPRSVPRRLGQLQWLITSRPNLAISSRWGENCSSIRPTPACS
jgi:hypothetical protein